MTPQITLATTHIPHDGGASEVDVLRQQKLVEALEWYAEQSAGCRKLGSIGDPFRQALDADGGKRARIALAAIQS